MVQSRIQRLLVLSILLGLSCLLGHTEGQTCREDYETLANTLINTSDNKYQLSITFFPTKRAPPAFVSVTYRYDDTNITDQTWFWSAGAFYFFQPLRIYQYMSLFFGNPELRSGTVTLTLPANCSNAQVPIMETLTQRLKLIASSPEAYPEITDKYQAKAASEETVENSFYSRDDQQILPLIHTVQVLFPISSCLLFIGCFFYWYCVKIEGSYCASSNKDWSTLAAYYGVSLYFTLLVFTLDVTAVYYRANSANSFITGDDLLKNLVITPLVFDTMALVFILVLLALGIISCIVACKNKKQQKNSKCLAGLTPFQYQFVLSLAGLAPFQCIASHTHFILIAWITDPVYASGIGVFYGISFFVYLVTFKSFYNVFVRLLEYCATKKGNTNDDSTNKGNTNDDSTNKGNTKDKKECPSFSCLSFLLTLAIGIPLTFYLAMIACFFIYIPITQSIEDAPTQVYAIYHGVIIVLTVVLAYVVVVEMKLSTIRLLEIVDKVKMA